MGRPPMRRDDEGNIIRDGDIRTKVRRRNTSHDDPLFIPPELKSPDMDYNWKRESTLGQEYYSYQAGLMENGWEPVPLTDMPRFGRPGDTGVVRRDGSVLMRRPKELSREAAQEDLANARQQVQGAVRDLTKIDFGGREMPNKGSRLNRVYDAPPADIEIVRTATDKSVAID